MSPKNASLVLAEGASFRSARESTQAVSDTLKRLAGSIIESIGGLKSFESILPCLRVDSHTIIYKRAARRYKTVGDANRAYRDLWRNRARPPAFDMDKIP